MAQGCKEMALPQLEVPRAGAGLGSVIIHPPQPAGMSPAPCAGLCPLGSYSSQALSTVTLTWVINLDYSGEEALFPAVNKVF